MTFDRKYFRSMSSHLNPMYSDFTLTQAGILSFQDVRYQESADMLIEIVSICP